MKRGAIFIALSMGACSISLAGEVTTWCANSDDAMLAKVVKQLDDGGLLIPLVPPEEERYLAGEQESIFASRTTRSKSLENHFLALQERRYYLAWKARKAYSDAKASVVAISAKASWGDPVIDPEGIKLSRAIDANSSLISYAEAFGEFLQKEASRHDGFVDSESASKHYFGNALLKHVMIPYMKCKLVKMVK